MLDEIDRTSESEAVMLYDKRFQGIQRLMNRYARVIPQPLPKLEHLALIGKRK
jgi:hypothetical protein